VTVPTTDSSLSIQEAAAPGVAVIALNGRVDAASVRTQRDQLHAVLDRGVHRIIFDLSSVSFLDSAGMAMLVSVLKRTRAVDGAVRVVEPSDESVRNILRLTRLDLVFDMQESLDAALRSLA
jgi:anti-sigma B factor antagonist